ncbi:MAG TPA: hypothetical protein PKA28_15875 [Methylomusa anaerophila]|uniref:Uncharacterized protein n=1 Tax=Methylomusa anaerophila TaxID=1930071 RepID=A0A348AK90_9FIRM|nr:hypothetical protein [Methylomusa anaerophila]BBB91488.1 hypothetical protein MAMMFC1_02172 [Methylomusa anaerophila]HML89923.1 hypothetical protein [Methylomusa anaerophila]
MNVNNVNNVSIPATANVQPVKAPGETGKGAADTQAAAELESQPAAAPAADSRSGTQAAAAASQVEVAMNELLSRHMAQLAKAIGNRLQLLDSLPPEIKEAVLNVLRQAMSAEETLAQGMAALVKSQNQASRQLMNLAELLTDAALVFARKEMPAGAIALFTRLAESNTSQAQAEQKLAAFAGQLLSGETTAAEFQQSVNELAKSMLGSDAAKAVTSDDQLARFILKQTGGNIPLPLEKLAAKHNLSEVTKLWVVLQANKEEGGDAAIPSPAQNRLLLLANQLLKQDAASMEVKQAVRNLAQELLVPATAKGLAEGDLAGSILHQLGKTVPDIFLRGSEAGNQSAARRFMAILKLSGGLGQQKPEQAVNIGPGITGADSTAIGNTGIVRQSLTNSQAEQTLIKLASQLLHGEMTAAEAKQAVQNMAKQLLGFDLAALTPADESAAKNLLKQTVTTMPQVIDKAVARYNMPEISRAWLLLQSVKLVECQGRLPWELKQAAAAVRELAETFQRPVDFTSERHAGSSVFSFNMPLYFGDGQAYPAYIHIYQQHEKENQAGVRQQAETWLRICLHTDHIGPVDSFYRLYDGHHLDVRVRFNDFDAANEFSHCLADIRKALSASSLELTDLSVRSLE